MKQIYGIINDDVAVGHEAVYGVRAAGLTAVVGEADAAEYRTLPQDVMMKHLVAHQQVVEQLAQRYPILPVQFGSLLYDDEQVGRMLQIGREQFDQIAKTVQGLVQVQLVISREGESGLPEESSASSMEAQLALARHQEGLGKMVRAQVDRFARGVVKHPLTAEEMVVNVRVLLAEDEQGALADALAQIRQALDGRYTVRCSEPMFPYSFVRVTVRAPKPEMIMHAREVLGLGLAATPEEMKEAFYNHDHYTRPDRDSDLDSIIKMTELAQAYKLLKELAVGQKGSVCRMDTAAVAESVLVSVQRLGQ